MGECPVEIHIFNDTSALWKSPKLKSDEKTDESDEILQEAFLASLTKHHSMPTQVTNDG